ncbi:alpha/beta fold hydrolase [Nonomuraea sp. NPDC059194]|uniref:alpha/beta fold hydrolase n=1 Tax=Nonomuraea sp. NPDC059194 TaxID=3346764 RepID=UPI00369D1815
MSLRRVPPIVLLALLVAAGCGPASPTPVKGRFAVAQGRSLAIDCAGSGTVTVILEVGYDAAGTAGQWRMAALRDRLTPAYYVCNYDRANLGRSDPAPKPRTTGDIADDLAALLKAAKVPGPYLLVGVSAGGLYVQHYAARHPDQVVGVLAMNPQEHVDKLNPVLLPLLTADERAREQEFQAGRGKDSTQGIDLTTSARQLAADGPLRVPLTIMESASECPDGDDTCGKIFAAYTGIHRKLVADAAPGGRYVQVKARHDLYLDVPDLVSAEIEHLTRAAR